VSAPQHTANIFGAQAHFINELVFFILSRQWPTTEVFFVVNPYAIAIQ
jgi:hypothetical protein